MSSDRDRPSLVLNPSFLGEVNADILPDGADTRSLGSTAKEWLNLYIGDAGKIYLGLGQDVYIQRSAANTIKLYGALLIDLASAVQVSGQLAPKTAATTNLGSPTKEWAYLYLYYGIYFGDAQDVDLYRSAANTLRTSDALNVDGKLVTQKGSGYGISFGQSNEVWFGEEKAADSAGYINYRGYNEAFDYFRDLIIGDGKGHARATFVGSAGQLQIPVQGVGAGLLIGEDTQLYRSAADVLKTPDAFDAASFKAGGVDGVDGSFTTADGKTVTVTKGIITSIV